MKLSGGMRNAKDLESLFGMTETYFLIDPNASKPFSFQEIGQPKTQGLDHCGLVLRTHLEEIFLMAHVLLLLLKPQMSLSVFGSMGSRSS